MNRRLFATTAKGVEAVLARELERLGMREVKGETGGVSFTGNATDVYRANLWLRTANRVLLQLVEFECRSEDELYENVRRVDWREHLNSKMTLAVDANVRDSAITHSKYAALKVKDAVVDQFRQRTGARPSVDVSNPDLRINVHILRDRCTLSLDSSGDSLHKRGYRVAGVEAPLKETLAAAIIELTGWNGESAFVDPMCGSGTLVIEAALKAADIAPGLLIQDFGFQRWLNFDSKAWQALVKEAESAKREVEAPIIGSDLSAKAIAAAAANARAAGVAGFVSLSRTDFRDMEPPPPPGVVVINPPYGERLGDKKELEYLYKAIGDMFKKRFAGYTGFIFTGNLDLAKRVGLRASKRHILFNGPIESRLIEYTLY